MSELIMYFIIGVVSVYFQWSTLEIITLYGFINLSTSIDKLRDEMTKQ